MALGAMPTDLAIFKSYQCDEYTSSRWASDGLWDEAAQLWVLEPMPGIEELSDIGFLQVGRPGVDSIGFGYRSGKEGFWAYYPLEGRFALLAPTLAAFVSGWSSGTISV